MYPGDPKAQLYPTANLKSDGYSDYRIESGMHVGTHMDAPLHMIADGSFISDISLNSLIAAGHLVDARNHHPLPPELIDLDRIKPGSIVLVFTGFGHNYGQPNYYKGYPEFSLEFAHRLVEAKIAAVGMDTPSPDGPPFAVHKVLLPANILLIENLNNLDKLLVVNRFRVMAFPLKLKADAAPARVIAEILD